MNRARILLVEDNGMILILYSIELQDAGYITEEAGTGALALSRLSDFNPDLMVVDCMLPDMDGEALVSRVRKQRPNLPVIYCTGKLEPPESSQDPPTLVLRKPFQIETLVRLIGAVLGKPRRSEISGAGMLLQPA